QILDACFILTITESYSRTKCCQSYQLSDCAAMSSAREWAVLNAYLPVAVLYMSTVFKLSQRFLAGANKFFILSCEGACDCLFQPHPTVCRQGIRLPQRKVRAEVLHGSILFFQLPEALATC